ncbi:DUF5691 domain-containing protein [Hymenobacter cellulosivorans]|uniref:DUF5691 domain-containing protein n=1 Tax=Hymenobacter cellulosivorans TaxID=2932249 RepID=A0ABY4F4X1_9BACT|nr:DUF5691 domain-containing protein [Hymenobacter cellulosivorans]UOQ51712.1 DUF5691 domain-containing protein [Hymenobacter cellulosivorans]
MTDASQAWSQLMRIALLGTGQTTEAVPQIPGFTPPAAPEDTTDHPEKLVLLTAAALALVRKAGRPLPVPTERLVQGEPAPAELLPALGGQAQEHLELLLEARFSHLLPNYLQQMARHDRRVPHRLLVPLLELARTQAQLGPLLNPVIGERGRWLAGLNPAWSLLSAAAETGEFEEAEWETGTVRQRHQMVSALRRRQPARARELLTAALPQEPAKNQAQLLAALTLNLSSADGALLEQYLASKSKEVRQTVLPLLAKMPDSPLVERLWARAEALLRLDGKAGSKRLVVTLPADWDKSWLADGVEQKDSRFAGEKGAWLGQMLSLIPPARWTKHWRLSPAEILALAAGSDWAAVLLRAWYEALLLHQAADWALAYAQAQFSNDKLPLLSAGQAVDLLGATGPVQELLLSVMPTDPLLRQPAARWETWLLSLPGPWSVALTHRAFATLATTLRAAGASWNHTMQTRMQQLLRHMEQAVPPEQYEFCAGAMEELQALDYANYLAYNQLLETLDFRRRLAQALTEPADPDS